MTIVEVIDAKKQNQTQDEEITMRINWLQDNNIEVIRSHGMGYLNLRNFLKKEANEVMGLERPQLYESYHRHHFGVDPNFIQYR